MPLEKVTMLIYCLFGAEGSLHNITAEMISIITYQAESICDEIDNLEKNDALKEAFEHLLRGPILIDNNDLKIFQLKELIGLLIEACNILLQYCPALESPKIWMEQAKFLNDFTQGVYNLEALSCAVNGKLP